MKQTDIGKHTMDFQGLFIIQALLLLLAVPSGMPFWFSAGLESFISIFAIIIAWQLVRINSFIVSILFIGLAFLYNPVSLQLIGPKSFVIDLGSAFGVFAIALFCNRLFQLDSGVEHSFDTKTTSAKKYLKETKKYQQTKPSPKKS